MTGAGAAAGAERTVLVAGGVLVGRTAHLSAQAGAGREYLVRAGDAWLDGPGSAAALGARDGGARSVLLADVGDDPQGSLCRQVLDGRGVDTSGVTVRQGWATGTLFEVLTLSGQDDDDIRVTLPAADRVARLGGPRALPWDVAAGILASTRPGDCLLIDSLTLADSGYLVAAAVERDLQVVADLRPFPQLAAGDGVDSGVLERVDVAVVDPPGAGLLAESGALVGSVLALGGAHGASWDGQVRLLEPALAARGVRYDRWAPVDPLSPWAHHAFCGRLAAELARGRDREEALDAALATWWQHATDLAHSSRELPAPVGSEVAP